MAVTKRWILANYSREKLNQTWNKSCMQTIFGFIQSQFWTHRFLLPRLIFLWATAVIALFLTLLSSKCTLLERIHYSYKLIFKCSFYEVCPTFRCLRPNYCNISFAALQTPPITQIKFIYVPAHTAHGTRTNLALNCIKLHVVKPIGQAVSCIHMTLGR